jgi:hypothetical protein
MRIYSSGETRVVSAGTVLGAFTTQSSGTSTAIFLGRHSATAGNVASAQIPLLFGLTEML